MLVNVPYHYVALLYPYIPTVIGPIAALPDVGYDEVKFHESVY